MVIGRTTRGIERSEALGCVFGYTVGNDVSARDQQKASNWSHSFKTVPLRT